MKKSLLIFLVGLFTLACQSAKAQEASTILTLNNNQYLFDKVVEMPGKSKADLFTAIKSWVIKNVKTQSNTNYFDEANNSISTTIAFPVYQSGIVDFKLNIDIKDGKFKLSAQSFVFHNFAGVTKPLGDFSGLGTTKKTRQRTIEDVDKTFPQIVSSIEEAAKGKSDW